MDNQHNPEHNYNDEKLEPDKSDQHSSAEVGGSNIRDNRNVSSGSGDIHDYGGVQGGVHSYGGVRDVVIHYNLPDAQTPGSSASVPTKQTVAHAWQVGQTKANLNFNPELKLKRKALAIVFPITVPIIKQVCNYLRDELSLSADIVVITNSDDPKVKEGEELPANQPDKWKELTNSFAALLERVGKDGHQPAIHLFISAPAALAYALGISAGYNNSHPVRIYHFDRDDKRYHLIYQRG